VGALKSRTPHSLAVSGKQKEHPATKKLQ